MGRAWTEVPGKPWLSRSYCDSHAEAVDEAKKHPIAWHLFDGQANRWFVEVKGGTA